ncbi:MAG: iron-sulfur cluster carrier protein ApbC [Gammaproteobacteria bacterium]|nr:iron-sulfur cluster carrier protein ApbC [Gammaproteobacteria bacterium]
MMSVSEQQIESALQGYVDEYLEQDLVAAKCVKNIAVDGDKVAVDIRLGFPAEGYQAKLAEALKAKIEGVDGVSSATINVSQRIEAHTVQKGVTPIPGVKNIIAVASGKGGVGKSTTTVNLALALAAEGATVGILDADIYGPSQPRMMGINKKPTQVGDKLEPLVNHGVQTMSIGYMIEEDTPMIWRGPMVTQALEQLLNDTNWQELDYLLIDMPPGTGDIQLTLAQKVPVSGAVIVTTPQDIALIDAKKGLKMFEKVDVPVLGVVENMSIHICSNCGHEEHIFGTGGGGKMADEFNVDMLGALPLNIGIREDADIGKPTVASDPEGQVAGIYREVARRMAAKLSKRQKEYSHKFPNIVIQNS